MSENNNQWWFRIQQTNCILSRGVLLQDPCTLPLLFCRIYPCYIKECLGLHSAAGGFQSAHGKTKSVKQACLRKDGRLWPAGVQVLSLIQTHSHENYSNQVSLHGPSTEVPSSLQPQHVASSAHQLMQYALCSSWIQRLGYIFMPPFHTGELNCELMQPVFQQCQTM